MANICLSCYADGHVFTGYVSVCLCTYTYVFSSSLETTAKIKICTCQSHSFKNKCHKILLPRVKPLLFSSNYNYRAAFNPHNSKHNSETFFLFFLQCFCSTKPLMETTVQLFYCDDIISVFSLMADLWLGRWFKLNAYRQRSEHYLTICHL